MEEAMESSDTLRRNGHRLLQAGGVLFLLGLLVGLAVPRFAVPRLGLSAHLLGIMQGIFLMVVGLLWPRLSFTPLLSRIGCGLAMYGCLAAWVANVCGAVWGAGSSMVPLAAGGALGRALQEGVIRFLLRSGAVCLVSVAALILWGLRSPPK
jgi:hydroxylaminobenzene mutase